MTIALGLLANNGIVVAADSLLTVGEAKTNHGKVTGMTYYDQPTDDLGACAIAASGVHDAFIFSAAEQVRSRFNRDRGLIGADWHRAIEEELTEFHQSHVYPLNDLPNNEPSVG